ncbi:hypothetical protein ADL22_30630 [Streptomyces sp. NRRL F-4489]|uniref:hypothetical protein n=1 Tax=Streptomyces sp. NRRL F-4489 TaxID=1609095 RepID=UPI00074A0500|nr:hypothetical protein [Streptomyces sp. NRRL F-4489]KUL34403.1 hypothetical protein ADL22_30630 [Streptomyces sp. NRRL F-4489]
MAELRISGDALVVRLSWWEKAAGRHGDVRVPLSAVRRVSVEPDWWRALRGTRRRGLWVPQGRCVGVREHAGGRDFVAVRPHHPVVCVELRPPAPFDLLAVSPAHPQTTADRLRQLAPAIDPVRWRQAISPPPDAA